eukprot:TRINITY_DN5399_c0_g2_i1.p1 TRINITY_DN5399_c0_g2~~TRINITY_DN5399_c0_g2_i1.p1  ORF type:complete len:416 (+),score=85.72 TRINITY_DN5399_c0_g2_i1:1626-2873(+)
MKQASKDGKRTNIFKKLERLEEHVAARRDLVDSLVQSREDLRSSSSNFKEARAALEALIKDPGGRPLNLPLSYGRLDSEGEAPQRVTTPLPVQVAPALSPAPQYKFVDATNLCLLFKAFQPFLDRNTPHDVAMDVLHSILQPSRQAYRQFAVPSTISPSMLNNAGSRQRRRKLIILQNAEQCSDGGITSAKLKIAGYSGEVTPLAFKTVLKYLTEGRLDDTSIRVLFTYFDIRDKCQDEAVNLHNFLDGLDDVIQDHKHEVISQCYSSVCRGSATTLSRGDIYAHSVPSGKLTPGQAHCLLEHFPPEAPLPKLPPLKRKKDQEKHKLMQSELSALLVKSYREGATMNRRQFDLAFDESPYILVCFLETVLRFTVSIIAKEAVKPQRKVSMPCDSTGVSVYNSFFYPSKVRPKGKK